ncbi:spore cortex-lytic enzyme [Hazenella sp. IB182353]|nr:spore cortex-lytic enzyme [Polycladospora coralii]
MDGIVGNETWKKLRKATNDYHPSKIEKRFPSPKIKRGDSGGNVYDIQGRLKYLGFFTGKIDGQFGDRTQKAVRLFQYEFGLKIDGIVGAKTLSKLKAATTKYAPPKATPSSPKTNKPPVPKSSAGMSQADIQLLAQAVYAEGRGEPYVGQVAIAAVILNRLESQQFPNTISGIIYQPLAFEAVADGQINLPPNDTARKAVMDALNGWDPAEGAVYYFNPDRATSKWIWSRPQIKTIGKHIFMK